MIIPGPKGRDTRYSDTLRGQGGCSRIMSNPAPVQAEGQGSEAGSTDGAAVPSLQRTVQGSPVGTEFRIKARANVQAMLQQERHKHEGADRKKMLCPIDFHSKIAARHDRRLCGRRKVPMP